MNLFLNLVHTHASWMHIGLLMTIAALLHLAVIVIYKIFMHRFALARFVWTKIFLESLRKPLIWVIWFITITSILFFTSELLFDNTKPLLFFRINAAGIALIFLMFCFRMINAIEVCMMHGDFNGRRFDKTTVVGLAKLLRIFVIAITFLIILQESLGVSVAAIYAAAGGIGIGLTFAAQDILKNFFGGFVLYFDRPFGIGDTISSPDRQMEGTVQKIGWRTTRILTSCHRPLYVPNAIFLTVSVENNSRMLNYRIKQNIGIRYDDYKVLPSIITQIKQLLQTDERLDLTQTNYVNITEFAASAITVQIYVYTRTTEQNEYQDIQQDILLKILQIVEKNQAQTAFPTSTIHVPNSITISQSGK